MKIYKSVTNTKKITAVTNIPNQGIFWFVGDDLVALCDPVDIRNYTEFGALNHKDAWRHLCEDYPVDGKPVSYNYYPRGRVIVTPEFDDDYNFTHYICYVYADLCIIKKPEFRSAIEAEFGLYLSTCDVYYEDQLSLDGTHYTCYMCRH